MESNQTNSSWRCGAAPQEIVSIISINVWLISYWVTGILTVQFKPQIILMCLSLILYNLINDFSLVLILVSQLIRSKRYVGIFGNKGLIIVIIFSFVTTVYKLTQCHVSRIWIKFVGIGLAVLTYIILFFISYRKNTVLRPVVIKLAVLYLIVLMISACSRLCNEPKLFFLAILMGVNDYSDLFKKIDKLSRRWKGK